MTDIEEIRAEYRPTRIRFLMIGESPPLGRRFFYTRDSTLFGETLTVMKESCGFSTDPVQFLKDFMSAGFFLDDFSSVRGDKPAKRLDAPDVELAVQRIADEIRHHKPIAVLGVLLSISALVERAVVASATDASWAVVPFPHYSDSEAQARYRTGLAAALATYGCKDETDAS